MQYWIARNNQKVGPYSLEDVHRMMADNKLVQSDLAWTEGMPNWGPAFDVIPAPKAPEPIVHPASAFDALAPTRMIPAMRTPPGYDAPQQQAAPQQVVPQAAASQPSFQPQAATQQPAPAQAAPAQANPVQSSPVQPSSVQPSTYQPNPYPPPAAQQPAPQPAQPMAQQAPQQYAPQPGPYAPAQPSPAPPSQYQPPPPVGFAPANQPFQPSGYAPPPAGQASFQPPPPAAQAPPYQPYSNQPMQGQPMPGQPMGGQPMQGQAAPYQASNPAGGPIVPPGMHWVVVWLLGAVTFGIFIVVWMFKQANFVKRIDPSNQSKKLFTLTFLLAIVYGVTLGAAIAIRSQAIIALAGGLGLLVELAAVACSYIGYFKMRTSLLNYYNTVEPIGLRLSGVMTFFFNILYFQYHFHRIAQWKQTGMLTPQK